MISVGLVLFVIGYLAYLRFVKTKKTEFPNSGEIFSGGCIAFAATLIVAGVVELILKAFL